MKIHLILFSLFLGSNLFGQNTSDVQLELIDGLTNLPLTNFEIELTIRDKESVSFKTNEYGMFTIVNYKKKYLYFRVENVDKKFHSLIQYSYKLKNFPGRKIKVFLYPKADYEKQLEDKQATERETNTCVKDSLLVGKYTESEAMFPGGTSELFRYILENVNYPYNSIELDEQGRVFISCVVECDGTITNVAIEKSVSKYIDMEAKRLVRAMPKWIPGYTTKGPVRTRIRLPINFSLK